MRLFVAIPVPASVCNRIAAVQMELETEFPNVRWNLAKLESFHITVRFLGDVDVACVDNLVKRLRDAASTVERFDLSACGMGCFPITNFPRVIWVGCRDAHAHLKRLERLHQVIDRAAGDDASQPAEIPYVGHLTVARVPNRAKIDRLAISKFIDDRVSRDFGTWNAESIELIQSRLEKSGRRYVTLRSFQFAGNDR